MEQQIRFCTTSDGVRIAYATVGKGPPVVRVLGWFTHLEMEWQAFRPAIEWLAKDHLYVRFDGRGMGLSDREVDDFSSEAHVRDLEAVVEAVNLKRFALIAWSQGGPTAIRYAVQNPDRVSRLVLYGSFATDPSRAGAAMDEAMLTFMREGWDSDRLGRFFADMMMPDADSQSASFFIEFQRASTPRRNAAAITEEVIRVDVRDLLPKLKVPTLVIHRRGDTAVSFEAGRELAALIPGARLVPLEGRNHVFVPGEPEFKMYQQAVEEFLAEDRTPARRKSRKASAAAPSGLVTILFTDMEGSTSLTQRLGDAGAQELLRTHNSIVREALKAQDGAEIKHTGDGIMASFHTASKALACAAAIQTAFAERNETAEEPINVRIGLNAGEPVAEDEDLFGTAVQLAARVCAHAAPGTILAANVVRELSAGKGFLFSDQGDVVLRGFEDPVRLYEVRAGAEG